MITLARNLQIEFVAEGVEAAGQVALLQTMGCDYAQGYYFARPMLAPQTEDFVINWRAAAA